ncbi:MAG: alpha/beta hydrolase [Bacilli bacterium]|nr:alpha/beta hydrolase [Bacilli bacterium]
MSDKFGVWMIKSATKLDSVKERKAVDFKALYSSKLSPDYKYPKSIDFEIISLDGVKVEVIKNVDQIPKYALIQLHGGAYVMGYNDTYRKVAKTYLAFRENMAVYSLRYSLAPRHPYPHALNESIRLFQYLLDQGYDPNNIIIAGDSAGGGLAIATSLYLRDHNLPMPKALIVMSPWTNLAMNGKSHEFNKLVDPMFGEGTQPLNVKAYVSDHDVTNPYISPKYGSFDTFTDMLMFVGGDELIWSDTMDVAESAKENNEIIVHDFEGMFHVFPLAFQKIKSSRTAWQLIQEYIQDKLRG